MLVRLVLVQSHTNKSHAQQFILNFGEKIYLKDVLFQTTIRIRT